jgi:hypothetical protein
LAPVITRRSTRGHKAIDQADSHRQRLLLPGALLVAGLSLLAAWVLRSIAPPSLVRGGERLPVGIAGQHAQLSVHRGSAAGDVAFPSPISDEPVPHFFGIAFLTAHLLIIVLAAGIPLIRLAFARFRWHHTTFAAALTLALLAAVAAGVAGVLAARFGYGDRLPIRDAFRGGVEVTRYGFVAALAIVVTFGFPSKVSADRSEL